MTLMHQSFKRDVVLDDPASSRHAVALSSGLSQRPLLWLHDDNAVKVVRADASCKQAGNAGESV